MQRLNRAVKTVLHLCFGITVRCPLLRIKPTTRHMLHIANRPAGFIIEYMGEWSV